MKILVRLVILFAFVFLFVGCGNGGGGSPTDPVEGFFAAFEEMNAEKAAEVVCLAYRDDVKAGLDLIFGFMSLGGSAEIEIVDLKLGIAKEAENEASVVVTGGKIKVKILDEVQEQDIAETAEAVKIVKENGKWLLCDVSFAEGFSP